MDKMAAQPGKYWWQMDLREKWNSFYMCSMIQKCIRDGIYVCELNHPMKFDWQTSRPKDKHVGGSNNVGSMYDKVLCIEF